MVINWTNPAISDLESFKRTTKMNMATEYIKELVESTNLLLDYPRLGKIYIYTNTHIVRQLIHNQHKIFYYIDEDVINIVAIIHFKQDINKRINYIKQRINRK